MIPLGLNMLEEVSNVVYIAAVQASAMVSWCALFRIIRSSKLSSYSKTIPKVIKGSSNSTQSSTWFSLLYMIL